MNFMNQVKTAALLVGMSVSAAQGAYAARWRDGTGPEDVTLRRYGSAGSGCPGGFTDGRLVSGGLLVFYTEDMTAAVGGGLPLSQKRKNCQFTIDLDYPAGWTFTVKSVRAGASADLGYGQSGHIGGAVYFQGVAKTSRGGRDFYGPESSQGELAFDLADGNFAPCRAERALNINFDVRATDPANDSGVGTVSLGGPLYVYLEWRRCD